jgi:ABC-type transporter Mla subunit MlaD
MADNLFDELKDALQEFKDFLDDNVATIKPAVNALADLIPQVNDLINELVNLMNTLKTEIQNLDVSGIPGLSEVSEFTSKTTSLLTAAKNLLPDAADEIDQVLGIAEVVTGLPSLDEVKAEIISLLDAIIAHLNSLKA